MCAFYTCIYNRCFIPRPVLLSLIVLLPVYIIRPDKIPDCKCRISKESCENESQICPSGCHIRRYENSCDETCPTGVYLVSEICKGNCQCRAGPDACNVTDGSCVGGCVAPFAGPKCEDCLDGYFDWDCKSTCHCKGEKLCNRRTGKCRHGCAHGYKGENCQEICPHQKYGPNCTLTCHCKEKHQTCNPPDWTCKYGCKLDFYGKHCELPCPMDMYLPNCTLPCHCKYGDECPKLTKQCPRGCARGYIGKGCQMYCQELYFGEHCEYSCNCKDTEEKCQRTKGRCKSGCREGYTGDTCQKHSYGARFGKQRKQLTVITTVSVCLLLLFLIVVVFGFARFKNLSDQTTRQHLDSEMQDGNALQLLPTSKIPFHPRTHSSLHQGKQSCIFLVSENRFSNLPKKLLTSQRD